MIILMWLYYISEWTEMRKPLVMNSSIPTQGHKLVLQFYK